jgi:hypothetical protein
MASRRSALKAASAVAVFPILQSNSQAQHQHSNSDAPPAAPQKPTVFNAQEFSVISQFAELIIPRTDTPGAIDAGVPLLMDREARLNPKRATDWRKGLSEMGALAGKPLVDLNADERLSLLTKMHDSKHWFFKSLKDSTIDLYYSTKVGTQQELKWTYNTFVEDYQGCTCPPGTHDCK